MSKSLLVGCSFLNFLEQDTPEIKIIGRSGAGNRMLAEIVFHELATHQYDQVNVIWSGINRIDVPIGKDLHKTFSSIGYDFYYELNDIVWYSSGGIEASGAQPSCPAELRKIFHTMYLGSTSQYLTNLSLSSITGVQSLLQAKNIPYHMAFIYDIDTLDYCETWLENILGIIDRSASLNSLVNWDKIQTKHTPYEWAQKNKLIGEDGFHPTPDAMIQWLVEHFDLHVTQPVFEKN